MPGARDIAYLSLERCEKQKKYSNLEIDTQIKKYKLTGAEKGLYVSLLYGTIERMLTLDFIISCLSSRDIDSIDTQVLIPLRLGLYQLIFMDRIPHSAAVDESVKITSKYANKSLGGFVNAVLRGFLRAMGNCTRITLDSVLESEPFKAKYDALDKYAALSVKHSYPEWLCKKLSLAYSDEYAERIMDAQNKNRSTSFRVNTLKSSRENVSEKLTSLGIDAQYTRFSPFGITCQDVEVSAAGELLESGDIFVQDEASQLAAIALGALPDSTLLDCCACPGGKSFSSAILMQNTGRVISCDLHESKLSLISRGAERLNIDIIETRECDSSVYSEELAGMLGVGADFVLCDVPCSGLGVIAKKPEVRYKSEQDIARLPLIQKRILDNCSKYVSPGGVLVYSTCTLNPDENENNVKEFIDNSNDFEAVDFSFRSDDGQVIQSTDGMLTLFPHIHATDGFFIAKMRRKTK